MPEVWILKYFERSAYVRKKAGLATVFILQFSQRNFSVESFLVIQNSASRYTREAKVTGRGYSKFTSGTALPLYAAGIHASKRKA